MPASRFPPSLGAGVGGGVLPYPGDLGQAAVPAGAAVANLPGELPRVQRLRQLPRDVVILASSSRSGSSMLATMLQQTRQVVMTQGEVNPLLRMSGIGRANGPIVDMETGQHLAFASLLFDELGFQQPPQLNDDYLRQLFWRIQIQWPDVDLSQRQVNGWARETVLSGGTFADFVMRARQDFRVINPHRYDLPKEQLRGVKPPKSAPSSVIEEPPFICPLPWRLATEEELRFRPLLVKGPAESYRFWFWSLMFPKARIRILHLTRNPAAAVNGLWDGWRSHNFHSKELEPDSLDMEGYSGRRGSDRWWKFDMPEGWERYRNRHLIDVCAFQWKQAHVNILDHTPPFDYYRVKFEDLQDPATRAKTMWDIFDWMGIRVQRLPMPRVVMATKPPALGRWRKRRGLIYRVLPRLRSLAMELDYVNPTDWT